MSNNAAIDVKINLIEEFLKDGHSCKDLKIDTCFKGYPIGEWALQIKLLYKSNKIDESSIHDESLKSYIRARFTKIGERVDRLIYFVRKYGCVWYQMGIELDDRIHESGIKDVDLVHSLYEQSIDDLKIIKNIRKRLYTNREQLGIDGPYDLTDDMLEHLKQANIDVVFGLSDENQREFKRLKEQIGLDDRAIICIFKNFGTYSNFKECYVRHVLNERKMVIPKEILKESALVTSLDISSSGTRYNTDNNYIDFVRVITGKSFIVYNGTEIARKINGLINESIKNVRYDLSEMQRAYICSCYGLCGERAVSFAQFCNEHGISIARGGQIREATMKKLRAREGKISDVIFSVQNERARKYVQYFFSKYDVFDAHMHVSKDSTRTGVECSSDSRDINRINNTVAENDSDFERAYDNAVNSNWDELKFGNRLLKYEGVPERVNSALGVYGVKTIGQVIEFSRKYNNGLYGEQISQMGIKTYNGLKQALERFGLVLEDIPENKRNRDENQKILEQIAEEDIIALYSYYKAMEYETCLRCDGNTEDDRVRKIKARASRIGLSDVRVESIIRARISQLLNQESKISIGDMLLPKYIKTVLIGEEIKNLSFLYKKQDVIEKILGPCFDILKYEIKRMNLQIPCSSVNYSNSKKYSNNASYRNRYNMELLRYMIDTSELSNEKKKDLYKELIRGIDTFSQAENEKNR